MDRHIPRVSIHLTILLNALTRMSRSESDPLDFKRSTSRRNLPIFSDSRLFFSANVIARLFNSVLDEYFLWILSSIKLKTYPHFLCPKVPVEGPAEVFMKSLKVSPCNISPHSHIIVLPHPCYQDIYYQLIR